MKLLSSRFAWMVPVGLTLLSAGPASALTVEVCLRVDQYQIPGSPGTVGPFGNTAPIPMWAFVQTGTGPGCTFSAPGPGPSPTAHPFPTIKATVGDTLLIRVVNNLPLPAAGTVYTEPVSVVIPGQTSSITTAVWFNPATGLVTGIGPDRPVDGGGAIDFLSRVRSFALEAPQQSPDPVTYSFGNLKAGTYLIQSGTHPSVQVQMGLYGVLQVYQTAPVAPATNGRAYSHDWTTFDSERALLFSEIDPVLHDAVAGGQYGPNPSPPAGWLTSTVDYQPKYFLVNGRPYVTGAPPVQIGATNRKVLLRFLNAGLETKVPLLQGQYAAIVAEDGNLLSARGFTGTPPNLVPGTCLAPRQQYSVLLPAGKTTDAILTTPASPVSIPVYDRRLNLTNNGASPGGMLTVLTTTSTGGGATPPAPPPVCSLVGAPQ